MLASMDPHRIAEARSLAYHRVVAERLTRDPQVIERARKRIDAWLAEPNRSSSYLEQWRALLAGPRERLLEVLRSMDEQAKALRQCTPFPGELDPRERWELWRRVRDELEKP